MATVKSDILVEATKDNEGEKKDGLFKKETDAKLKEQELFEFNC